MSETSSSANSLFLNTSPGRLFLLAALPGAISMLASSLYGLLDGIFVGQSLGETAFASLNLAFPFVIINFSLADLIGVGSAVPHLHQSGDEKGPGGQQRVFLRGPYDHLDRRRDRRPSLCRRALSHWVSGRGGPFKGLCRPVHAGLCRLFPGNHHCFRHG